MIDFSAQTYANILTAMLARIPNTYDKRDTAPIPTALGPAAYTFEGFYLTLDQVQQQAFLQTAVGQSLDYLGVIAGLTRYPASPARVQGVFDKSVPLGSRFSSVNGENSINYTVTAPLPQQNNYVLTAETVGSVGNDYTGIILPISTIPGLTSAQIASILIPGDDVESDEAFRARIIAALNNRPFGGNIASYRDEILKIDGVGAVQIYPVWNGGGTVKASILGSDFLPASSTLVATVQTAIDPPTQGEGLGIAPIGATVTVTAPDGVTIDVLATVTLAAGYAVGQVQQPIEDAIEAYLLSVRQGWDTNTESINVAYAADVYLSRVLAAILTVPGVVNATNVQINGDAADLHLTETGAVQQVPILGTVTLNG